MNFFKIDYLNLKIKYNKFKKFEEVKLNEIFFYLKPR